MIPDVTSCSLKCSDFLEIFSLWLRVIMLDNQPESFVVSFKTTIECDLSFF